MRRRARVGKVGGRGAGSEGSLTLPASVLTAAEFDPIGEVLLSRCLITGVITIEPSDPGALLPQPIELLLMLQVCIVARDPIAALEVLRVIATEIDEKTSLRIMLVTKESLEPADLSWLSSLCN